VFLPVEPRSRRLQRQQRLPAPILLGRSSGERYRVTQRCQLALTDSGNIEEVLN
jgi:hypothetical protein